MINPCEIPSRLIVSDFGTAQLEGTHVKDVASTTSYAPPENLVIGTDRTAHFSTDIYAAGLVIYTMMTGREPFASCSSMTGIHLILAIRNGFENGSYNPWTLRPEVDPLDPRASALISLATRCLHLDPHQRPSARQALDTLESII